jgi:hypothetical protein
MSAPAIEVGGSLLTELDRIVVAAFDRGHVIEGLCKVLGAEVVGRDQLPVWSAARTTLRAGISEIEVLEPRGVGALADFMGRRGPGLFAVGLASADPERFRAHLQAQGVFFEQHGQQLFLTADKGIDLPHLNLVITPAEKREPAGLLERLWSATLLHRSVEREETLTRVLGERVSDVSEVSPISSQLGQSFIQFGRGRTSQLSILSPRGRETPVDRFFVRYGGGIYMASAFSAELTAIDERLRHWRVPVPERSAEEPLLIPSELLGGARLAVFPSAIGCTRGNVAARVFEAERAWGPAWSGAAGLRRGSGSWWARVPSGWIERPTSMCSRGTCHSPRRRTWSTARRRSNSISTRWCISRMPTMNSPV